MMGFFDILTGGLVDSVGNAIDKLVTSDEERLSLKNELTKIKEKSSIRAKELENDYQKQITSRWKSDNKSSILARNVRPLTLIFLMIVLTSMAFTSGNIGGFKIADNFVDLFQVLSITAFGAYFGSRGLEKIKGNK